MGADLETWKLQDAKARFSEVIREATAGVPQIITLRGRPAVVVLSKEVYDKLTSSEPSFVEFMRRSPLAKVQIDIRRDPSLTREIDL